MNILGRKSLELIGVNVRETKWSLTSDNPRSNSQVKLTPQTEPDKAHGSKFKSLSWIRKIRNVALCIRKKTRLSDHCVIFATMLTIDNIQFQCHPCRFIQVLPKFYPDFIHSLSKL